MLKRIKMAVVTMLVAGTFVMPVWAQQCPPVNSSCPNVVPEQEPNNGRTAQEFQDLGMLRPGECVTVSPASIDGGANSPNSDVDFYVLGLNGVSQLQLQLQPHSQVQFLYAVFDARTSQMLAECPDAVCPVPVQTDFVVIGVIAADVAEYSLNITTAETQPGFGKAALDAFNLADMQERVLEMR